MLQLNVEFRSASLEPLLLQPISHSPSPILSFDTYPSQGVQRKHSSVRWEHQLTVLSSAVATGMALWLEWVWWPFMTVDNLSPPT